MRHWPQSSSYELSSVFVSLSLAVVLRCIEAYICFACAIWATSLPVFIAIVIYNRGGGGGLILNFLVVFFF